MPVKFTLLVNLTGKDSAFKASEWTEVAFALLADDQSTLIPSGGGEARPGQVSQTEDLYAWKSGSVWRPDRESVSVESVHGVTMLRGAVLTALMSAGGKPPEGRISAIDARRLRTHLIEMIGWGKALEDLSVRVHARLRAPRLVGMAHVRSRTGLVRYDVEYRVESALEDAQDAVRNAEEIWHRAEARLTESRSVVVKSKGANLPRLSTLRAEAATLGRQVAMAQHELNTLVGQHREGAVGASPVSADLREKVRRLNVANLAVQELQAVVDADEEALYRSTSVVKDAREAWWRLKVELDARIADVNRRIKENAPPVSQPDATDPVSRGRGYS
jgi:hypothetical protein